MSAPHINPHAWITCPCPEDPAFDADSIQFSLSPTDLSTEGLHMYLQRKPRVGMLLSAELRRAPQSFTVPLVARVTAVEQHEGGWLTHCEWVEPMTEEKLQSLLGTSAK
jgi:hypothetical protein